MVGRRARSMAFAAVILAVACAAGCSFLVGPWWGMLLGVNVAAFLYYGFDKYRAVRSGWRVPEAVLLGFVVVGGLPGSWIGQQVFRHKTSKLRFKRAFWAIGILQAAAVIALVIRLRGS